MKKKILFILHLPPPVHGMSVVNEQIRQSSQINNEFNCQYINLSTSRTTTDIGRYGLLSACMKSGFLCVVFVHALWKLLTFRPDTCYLTITCHGIPFLKDAPIVLLCKLFCHNIILHQHNKGMSTCVHSPLFRFLLHLVYRNTTVILLSWKLYEDISSIVKREQIRVCPNGI